MNAACHVTAGLAMPQGVLYVNAGCAEACPFPILRLGSSQPCSIKGIQPSWDSPPRHCRVDVGGVIGVVASSTWWGGGRGWLSTWRGGRGGRLVDVAIVVVVVSGFACRVFVMALGMLLLRSACVRQFKSLTARIYHLLGSYYVCVTLSSATGVVLSTRGPRFTGLVFLRPCRFFYAGVEMREELVQASPSWNYFS